MLQINVHTAKTQLSKYLTLVEEGQTIILSRRNVPIAQLAPLKKNKDKPQRKIGGLQGSFSTPKTFFEPLSDDLIESFSKS